MQPEDSRPRFKSQGEQCIPVDSYVEASHEPQCVPLAARALRVDLIGDWLYTLAIYGADEPTHGSYREGV